MSKNTFPHDNLFLVYWMYIHHISTPAIGTGGECVESLLRVRNDSVQSSLSVTEKQLNVITTSEQMTSCSRERKKYDS